MKIAVDCYEAGTRATGVGRSIENIISNLAGRMPESEFFILGREPIPALLSPNIVQNTLSPDRGYFRWQNGLFRRNLKKIQPDILIASNYTLPVFCAWKSLLIVHDVSFASHPEWFSRKEVLKRKFLVQRSVSRAEIVVVDSESSKGELMKHFDIDPGKICVVYLGVDEGFQRSVPSQIDDWKKNRRLEGKRSIGFLGSIFNRRHIPVLVQAVERLRETDPQVALHIVGKDMTCPPQDISHLLNRDWILWEQGLAEEEIPLFYSSIEAFAYISEYEGFGLPPMEALACGTVPVLLNKSSLGEIYTGMSVLVEEPEVSLVAKALQSVLTDKKMRQGVLDAFDQRRAQFSWDRVAKAYEDLIREGGSGPHA